MKSNKALSIFLVGFAFIGICINIDTGISTAFVKSENSGLIGFLVYKLNEQLIGSRLSIDLFFNPFGYLLMLIGIKQLGEKVEKVNRILIAFLLAFAISVISMLMPLYISDGGFLIKLIVALYVLEGVALLYGLTSFVKTVKKKVDPYYNMDVGKDLSFAIELFFFAYFIIIIVMFACALDLWFFNILLYLDYIVMAYSVLYFMYKMKKHNDNLKIFE